MKARRFRPWWPLLTVLGVLVSLLVFLYHQSQAWDPQVYHENLAMLDQIRQLDAKRELAAMKSRIGLNASYDPLVEPVANLDDLQQRLTALSALSALSGKAARLPEAIAILQRTLEGRAALIESFKSHNAVLHNSLTFLPTAAHDIRQLPIQPGNAATQQALQARIEQLLLATLIFTTAASGEHTGGIEQDLAQLEALNRTAAPALSQRVTIFMRHVQTILREQEEVNRQLSQIAAEPAAAQIDVIQKILTGQQIQAGQQTRQYRLGLLVFSVALIALLLLAATRLRRNHNQLNHVNAQLREANDYLEQRVQQRTAALQASNAQLHNEIRDRKQRESQLIQSSKLASIGHLAAGIAHEINNPLGFISSNFNTLGTYLQELFELLAVCEQALAASSIPAPHLQALAATRARIEPDYLKQDIPLLLAESAEGMERVRKIVQDLKEFSRVDSGQQWQYADLHQNIDTTLNILGREIHAVADIVREYGALPGIECQPSQLNQVILNLLKNAAHAISPGRGTITIRTGVTQHMVWFEISDTGAGIPPEVLPHIFDPFFTTHAIGDGTGLGLSLSYGIVQEHGGQIEVQTAVAGGSTFRVSLPRQRLPQ